MVLVQVLLDGLAQEDVVHGSNVFLGLGHQFVHLYILAGLYVAVPIIMAIHHQPYRFHLSKNYRLTIEHGRHNWCKKIHQLILHHK